MFKILLALHVLFAIFAVGPLVHAATTASRGIRTADGAATASSARVLRIYGIASVVVVLLGFGLVSIKRTVTVRIVGAGTPHHFTDYLPVYPGRAVSRAYETTLPTVQSSVASFGDTWIWLSLVLWAVSIALVLAVLVPTLQKATAAIGAEQSVMSLTGRVAAAGGAVAVLFAVIVFLMVYRPGS